VEVKPSFLRHQDENEAKNTWSAGDAGVVPGEPHESGGTLTKSVSVGDPIEEQGV